LSFNVNNAKIDVDWFIQTMSDFRAYVHTRSISGELMLRSTSYIVFHDWISTRQIYNELQKAEILCLTKVQEGKYSLLYSGTLA